MIRGNTPPEDIINSFITLSKPVFFIADTGEPCVTATLNTKTKTFSLASAQWDDALLAFIRKSNWKTSAYGRAEITSELTALARESGLKQTVSVRVAKQDRDVYIDLGDQTYQVVSINQEGWEVIDTAPVPFSRPDKQECLPYPIPMAQADFITEFRKWFSVVDEKWLLLLTFILKCLNRDGGAYTILVIDGPKGSGKTTVSNRIKRIIDPSQPSSLSPPSKSDDIIVATVNSYLMVFDNISGIDHKMADVFCRLSTGGGLVKRKHYENHAEAYYRLHAPVIINGINEPSQEADFLDRCLTFELPEISNVNRIAATAMTTDFENVLPSLLGGLYSLLAKCLSELPKVQIKDLPRMTDFARMGIALERALKLKKGTFLELYTKDADEQLENSFWNDELCCAIFRKLEASGFVEGTADQLKVSLLRSGLRQGASHISARGFSYWLKRIEPILKIKGIEVNRYARTSHARKLRISWVDGHEMRLSETTEWLEAHGKQLPGNNLENEEPNL